MIAFYSEIRTQYFNTLCGQIVEFFNVKDLPEYEVATGF